MNVDDAIRELRSSVRGPADGLVDQIVAAAPTAPRVSQGRRVNGRAILVAASVSVAVILVLTLAFVLRDGSRPDPVPAGPAIPPARVDWGMTATVKLTPDQGVTLQEMHQRFASALAFRAHDNDQAGIEILSVEGDRATVRLPGADSEDRVTTYFQFPRVVVLDAERSLVATGADLEALEPEATKLLGSGSPGAFYVQTYQTNFVMYPPLEDSTVQRFESRSQANPAMSSSSEGRVAQSIATLEDTMVLGGAIGRDGDPEPVSLVRDVRAVPSSALLEIRNTGRGPQLVVDRSKAPRDDRRIHLAVDESGAGELGARTREVGSGTLSPDGTITLDGDADRGWMARISRPDLGGRVELLDMSRYGTPALPEGVSSILTPARAIPPAERRVGGIPLPDGSRWFRAATTRFDGAVRDFVVAVHGDRLVAAVLRGSGLTPSEAFVTPNISCLPGIGTPRVTWCGGTSGGSGTHAIHTAAGFAGRDIGRVVVEVDGVRHPAVVAGGMWVISFTVTGEETPLPEISGKTVMPAPLIGDWNKMMIRAWDKSGNEVPVSPARMIRD